MTSLGISSVPKWRAAQDSNLQHAALEAAASTNWATSAYPRQASNLHFPAFKAGPLPIGLRGPEKEWCAGQNKTANTYVIEIPL